MEDVVMESAAPAEVPKISLEVLATIKAAQAQHGLRHGDYQRYRQYCTRRLHRLRELAKMQCGKRAFQKKEVDVGNMADARHLCIPLMQAERCWAYSMQLKHESSAVHRKSKHARAKLRKATMYAADLEKLAACEDKCDARTALEAQAYSKFMVGNYAFELQEWDSALRNFNVAKKIWSQFAEAATAPEAKAMFAQRVQEMEPNIRYCAYSMGDSSAIDEIMHMDNVDELLQAKLDAVLAAQAQTLHQIKWKGRNIPVQSEKLRVSIVRIQDREKEIAEELANSSTERNVFTLFDKLLMDYQEAYSLYLEESREGAKQKGGKPSEEIATYLQFERLAQFNNRNRLMIERPESGRPNKPEENVRLLDVVLQNLQSMRELPGVVSDLVLETALNNEHAVTEAQRCFHVANAYVASGHYVEAAALFDRTLEHVRNAMGAMDNAAVQEHTESLQDLAKKVRGAKCAARARFFLELEEAKSAKAATAAQPLYERLDKFAPARMTDFNALIRFPPGFDPVACKPLFFDLALGEMPLPDVAERAKEQTGSVGGFLSGMFGWGRR